MKIELTLAGKNFVAKSIISFIVPIGKLFNSIPLVYIITLIFSMLPGVNKLSSIFLTRYIKAF